MDSKRKMWGSSLLDYFHKLKNHIKSHKILYSIILLVIVAYYFSLPRHLFSNHYSTVVFDRDGELVGARIAGDGQWRFPEDSVIPEKFKQCLVYFEDKHFYHHFGFNPVSLGRAFIQNIKAKKIVSGGSTITMQLVRLHRENKSRTVLEKLIEIVLATRLEFRYSKEKILCLYASHAPFGGNVVGLNAASWRYFGRDPKNLSWAESALLAVLPNSPAMIHPGKNRQTLQDKRNRLLHKLYLNGVIDQETYHLSLLEPLPLKPLLLPDIAPHLTENLKMASPGMVIRSTLKKAVQENLNRMVVDYYNEIKFNEIHNISAVIIEVNSGKTLAYVGNIPLEDKTVEGQDVDCAQAPRSTGSILKPFLYMAMQKEGLLLPGTLVPDIPTRILGFKPENYDLGYDGAVPAKRALARSLNIPAVRMLQMYGIPKFEDLLQKLGLTTLVYPPDHYGLTLIVGGAEGKLFEIANAYASMARELNQAQQTSVNSRLSAFPLGQGWAASIYLTFQALLEVNRPDEESGWKNLSSSRKIAWKTGTSYGFRDAWSIGTTPEYVVGVWVGNADGEGRPGLTGVGAAAPLMFRIFNSLPSTTWFQPPYDDMEKIGVCRLSGYKAGPYCDDVDSIYVSRAGVKTSLCPYHILVHLSPDKKYRVNSKCESVDKMLHLHWFVLPPAMEWYYRRKNVFYRTLPPYKKGCNDEGTVAPMELIYPTDVLRIFVPRELDGSPGRTIFEMAHRNPGAVLYWHVDNDLVATTKGIHQLSFHPSPGKHLLTVVDDKGNTISRTFEVVDKK
jgi:penicillin-binding protein 1C